MSSIVDRLWETVRNLPEPLLAEVLDFAEFLRARQPHANADSDDVSLARLYGGLENSQTFGGSPLAIQQRLRDEWR